MNPAAISASICCTALLYGCTTDSAINAESLFESRCSVCHGTSIPKAARKTKSQWNEAVERMIAKGAKLSPQEKKALVNYLAKRYKP